VIFSLLEYSGYSNVTDSTGYEEEDEEDEEDEEEINQSSQTKSSDNSFISQDWRNDYDEKAISETDGVYSEEDEMLYNQHTASKDGFSTMPDWATGDDPLAPLNDWPDQNKDSANASDVQDWPASENWVNNHGNNEPLAGPWEAQVNGNTAWHSQSHEGSVDSVDGWRDKEMHHQDEEDDEEGWTPDQHDDGIPTLANWQSQIHNNDITNGNGNADEWPLPGQQKPPTSKSAASPKNAWANAPDTIRTSNTRMSRQTNVYNVWNPEVAEAEVRQLTGTAMGGQMIQAKQLGHGRTQPRIADEGWGNAPNKYVAWDDVSRHGYNAEVLDQQKNTIYWRKENDNWKQCDQGLAETSTNAGEVPPTSSPSRAFSRGRADSYQSSADSFSEDHTRNKLPRDQDGSKYTKNPRNTRKLRDKLPPQKMAGEWGMYFGHETPSPEQVSKPPSPQQADASLVDIIDEFSPNRMNVHQNIHQPVANQWNDLANIFDNNTSDPKKVMNFTILLEPEENGSIISGNSRANINSSDNSSNINSSSGNSSSNINSSDNSSNIIISSGNSSSNIIISDNSSSSNSTTSPNINDTTIPTTTTTTTTTTIITNNSNNHTPVPTPSPFSSPAPPSGIFTTKIKLKIIPTKTDTLYINKVSFLFSLLLTQRQVFLFYFLFPGKRS
jgi:hypothetical protein